MQTLNQIINYANQVKLAETELLGESHLIQMNILGLEIFLALVELGGKWIARGYMSEQYAREYLLRKHKIQQINLSRITGDMSEYATYLQPRS